MESIEDKIARVLAGIVCFFLDAFIITWCAGVLLGMTMTFIQGIAFMFALKVIKSKAFLQITD